MNILYMDWDARGKSDILDSMERLGHSVILCSLPEEARKMELSEEDILRLKEKIEEEKAELVFSLNYFPTVSEAAEVKGCKYVSWVMESPHNNIYAENIINKCNRVYVFDRAVCDCLTGKGIITVQHAPFAVNVERYEKSVLSEEEHKRFQCDVSFVDSFTKGEECLYEQMIEEMTRQDELYTVGYLEGLLEAQMQIIGCDILTQNISDELLSKLIAAKSLDRKLYKYIDEKGQYVDDMLFRYLNSVEWKRLLEDVSKYSETFLYTEEEELSVGSCFNKGLVNYDVDLPKIFKASKVNLNITPRSIRTGVPFRAMEIMGAGGFLLTNYQEEFFQYFEPDVDFSYFTNKEEMLEKIQFFASHDEERKQIARNGLEKIRAEHTYEKRLSQILS